MELKQFPIPKSGHVNIARRGFDLFDVECTGLNTHDERLLMGFGLSMRGRFGEFRFEYGGVVHPKCRFDSDSTGSVQHGPGDFSITFQIRILP